MSKKGDLEEHGRVQIRASVNSLYSSALRLMSKKEQIAIGRIIDDALASHEEFTPYLKKVKELYDY